MSYTNDARFSVIRSANGDTWTLRIRSVQVNNEGLYECQVSSEPKISKSVRLKVVGEFIIDLYSLLVIIRAVFQFFVNICQILVLGFSRLILYISNY